MVLRRYGRTVTSPAAILPQWPSLYRHFHQLFSTRQHSVFRGKKKYIKTKRKKKERRNSFVSDACLHRESTDTKFSPALLLLPPSRRLLCIFKLNQKKTKRALSRVINNSPKERERKRGKEKKMTGRKRSRKKNFDYIHKNKVPGCCARGI